ncbi:hypothetical protein Ocin01_13051, partial [Orchesella cincta]
MSSRCKQCGEQIMNTGNYTFKILPAKRIPKKARKLMKKSSASESSQQELLSTSSWGADTAFQKFLVKRAQPANFAELTCGKCGAISKIKMLKNKFRPEVDDKIGEAVSTSVPKSKKRKAKGGRDKTAGLTMTWAGIKDKKTFTPQPVATSSASVNKSQPSKTEVVSAFKKKKDMENLKKVLFESKKKKSGSSLQDFLSA